MELKEGKGATEFWISSAAFGSGTVAAAVMSVINGEIQIDSFDASFYIAALYTTYRFILKFAELWLNAKQQATLQQIQGAADLAAETVIDKLRKEKVDAQPSQ